MDRLVALTPGMLGIVVALLTIKLVNRFVLKPMDEKFNSISWQQQNKGKVFLLGIAIVGFVGPVYEEMLFRAPLILLFGELTPNAWTAVFVVSGLFGLIHWQKKWFTGPALFDVWAAQEKGELATDSYKEVAAAHKDEKPLWLLRLMMAARVLATGSISIWLGYIGITYQSVWLCVLVHGLWNVIIPNLLSLLFMLAIFASFAINDWCREKYKDYKFWKRRRDRRKLHQKR